MIWMWPERTSIGKDQPFEEKAQGKLNMPHAKVWGMLYHYTKMKNYTWFSNHIT